MVVGSPAWGGHLRRKLLPGKQSQEWRGDAEPDDIPELPDQADPKVAQRGAFPYVKPKEDHSVLASLRMCELDHCHWLQMPQLSQCPDPGLQPTWSQTPWTLADLGGKQAAPQG